MSLSHNDDATQTNELTPDDFINGIVKVIQDCTPPKGIGINGYWGTGKTSALLQLKEKLDNKQVATVWFDAWRYQHEATPIIALLHQIRKEFNRLSQLLNETEKLGSVAILGAFTMIEEAIKVISDGNISLKLSEISKIGEEYERSHYQNGLMTEDVTRFLQKAIETVVGKEKKLVIFIDDLDRCNSEAALKLLEGIKIYLNLSNCVVVFAIDQRQIENALKKAFNNIDMGDIAEPQAREYLEKICQDIYHLPIPNMVEKSTYLINLLSGLKFGTDTEKAEYIRKIKVITDEYDCLPANPRKIKVLANRLAVMLRKPVDLSTPITNLNLPITWNIDTYNYALLLVMAIIYTFHRELNEQLSKNPAYIATLMNYSKDSSQSRKDNSLYDPMRGIKPSMDDTTPLPTNPNDSHVFRLHSLLKDIDYISPAVLETFRGT